MNILRTLASKWWFWVLAIPIGAWILYQVYIYYASWKANAPYREQYQNAVATYAKYEAQQLALQARYAADFDGGETPQETWDMFVAALKAGDTDQAAKYFVVEQQNEVAADFAVGKENGVIPLFLQDFELIEGGTMYPDGERFEFYTGSIDNGPGFVYVLVKNPITGVWKIEDL